MVNLQQLDPKQMYGALALLGTGLVLTLVLLAEYMLPGSILGPPSDESYSSNQPISLSEGTDDTEDSAPPSPGGISLADQPALGSGSDSAASTTVRQAAPGGGSGGNAPGSDQPPVPPPPPPPIISLPELPIVTPLIERVFPGS